MQILHWLEPELSLGLPNYPKASTFNQREQSFPPRSLSSSVALKKTFHEATEEFFSSGAAHSLLSWAIGVVLSFAKPVSVNWL